MRIPTAEEFVNMFGKKAGEKHGKNNVSFKSKQVRFAVVVDVDDPEGRPRIQFEGETSASVKRYPYYASYTPTVGDAVMVFHGVVQDKIIGKRL